MAEENVNVVNNDNTENDEQNQLLERQKRVDALLSKQGTERSANSEAARWRPRVKRDNPQ